MTMDNHRFESRLQSLADQLVYPPTPRITLPAPARATRSGQGARLRWASAAAIALTALFAITPTRAAILDFFNIGSGRIAVVDAPPLITPAASLADFGEPVTLAEARAAIRFDLKLPPVFGEPDRVYVNQPPDQMAVLIWLDPTVSYEESVRLALYQFGFSDESVAFHKTIYSLQTTSVNGHPAIWIDEPHLLSFDQSGYIDSEPTVVVNANVLIWFDGSATYRLETSESLEDAVAIAISLE